MKIVTIAAGLVMMGALAGMGWLISDLENARLQMSRLNQARSSTELLAQHWGRLSDMLGRGLVDSGIDRDRAAYRDFAQYSDFTPRVLRDLGVARRNFDGESLATLSDQILSLGAESARRAETALTLQVDRALAEQSRSINRLRSARSEASAEVARVQEAARRGASRLAAANAILAEESAMLLERERVHSRRLYGLAAFAILALGLAIESARRGWTCSAPAPEPAPKEAEATMPPPPMEAPASSTDLVPCTAGLARAGRATPHRPAGPTHVFPTFRTVLVVEDDAQVRAYAGEILHREGFEVLEARNGLEALSITEREWAGIDLILADVVMPRLSGHELADRLAERLPEMPVLLMSGYMDEAIAPRGSEQFERPLLHKPFSPEDLARKVREVLPSEAGRF